MELWCLVCMGHGKWVRAETLVNGDAMCTEHGVMTVADRVNMGEERMNAALGELSGMKSTRGR